MKRRVTMVLLVLMFCLIGGTAFAEDSVASNKIALDTVWVIIAGVLVMFMQPGFALLESGFSRAKNACNILMKNLMDFVFGSFFFWFIGFGVMFGAGNWFSETSGFSLVDGGEGLLRLQGTHLSQHLLRGRFRDPAQERFRAFNLSDAFGHRLCEAMDMSVH